MKKIFTQKNLLIIFKYLHQSVKKKGKKFLNNNKKPNF